MLRIDLQHSLDLTSLAGHRLQLHAELYAGQPCAPQSGPQRSVPQLESSIFQRT